jgi:cobalt-zinc-cadmium efflux system membrane fusion protein
MKKIILILILSLFTFSCGEKEIETKIEEESLPPSMTENSETKNEIIELNDEAKKDLTIEHYKVKMSNASYQIIVPASVNPAPEHIAIVAAPISGRISKIFKHEGEYVSSGEPLLEIQSIEYTNMIFDYLQSKNDMEIKQSQMERLKTLTDQNINSKKEFENSKYEFNTAKNSMNSAFSKLISIGLSKKEIEELNADETADKLVVRSKISGRINEHLIDIGEAVNIYDKLLTVIDENKVMVNAYISPEDAVFISTGDEVEISTVKDNPANSIKSKIWSINPALDEVNRSIVANALVNTKNGFPKPGQTIRVKINSGKNKQMLSIPTQAVLYEESDAFVFVKKGEGKYIKTPIEIAFQADNQLFLNSGIDENDTIALTQIFTLKALSKFDEFAE